MSIRWIDNLLSEPFVKKVETKHGCEDRTKDHKPEETFHIRKYIECCSQNGPI